MFQRFILHVRKHKNYIKVMGGWKGYVDRWWGYIYKAGLQKWNFMTTPIPRAELRKRNFAKTFSKNGVAEVELCEDVSLEGNCGSGTSQRHMPSARNHGSGTS